MADKKRLVEIEKTLGGDLDLMAIVLEGQHGVRARSIAQFFGEAIAEQGDVARANAWIKVARRLDQRARDRLETLD